MLVFSCRLLVRQHLAGVLGIEPERPEHAYVRPQRAAFVTKGHPVQSEARPIGDGQSPLAVPLLEELGRRPVGVHARLGHRDRQLDVDRVVRASGG